MKKERILVVDALRGFALLLIVLIHYVEHFDFFKLPEINYLFSEDLDEKVIETTFLLISGKAYSIFALLFGLSFFIQMDNKAQLGIDYRGRFFWRMIILLTIGFIHSLLYRGDILHIYALLSLPVILLYKFKTKYLWIIAGLLALQLPTVYQLIQTFIYPEYERLGTLKEYFEEGNMVYANGNLQEVIEYNFWRGRMTVWTWMINNGRHLQLVALFIVGIILGRKHVFEKIHKYKKQLTIVLVISLLVFFGLTQINNYFQNTAFTNLQKGLFDTLLGSAINLSLTSIIITLIIIAYIKFNKLIIFKLFAAYGKMSLSNYIFQAIFGVVFFYYFGLGMYRYFGSTLSILLGTVIFFTQSIISMYWNKRFYYGPLEWIWRCATNLDFSINFKKPSSKL